MQKWPSHNREEGKKRVMTWNTLTGRALNKWNLSPALEKGFKFTMIWP